MKLCRNVHRAWRMKLIHGIYWRHGGMAATSCHFISRIQYLIHLIHNTFVLVLLNCSTFLFTVKNVTSSILTNFPSSHMRKRWSGLRFPHPSSDSVSGSRQQQHEMSWLLAAGIITGPTIWDDPVRVKISSIFILPPSALSYIRQSP